MKLYPSFKPIRTILLIALLQASAFTYAQTPEEHYKIAKEALKKEKFKEAQKHINIALAADSANLDYQSLQGHIWEYTGEYYQAFTIFSDIIAKDSKNPIRYDNRGLLHFHYGNYLDAVKDHTKAIELATADSSKAGYLCNRATSWMYVRDFQKAYDDLIQGFNLDSTSLCILTNLGAICDEVGKEDDAIYYLKIAIKVDSTFMPAYMNIGFRLQKAEKYEESIPYFDKAINLDPKEAFSYNNRGYSKFKAGDIKGALNDINKSISLDPENSYAYRNRALIYISQNKMDKACKDLQTAMDKKFTARYGNEVRDLQRQYCEK